MSSFKSRICVALGIVIGVVAVHAAPTLAQEASAGLEEVTVTARKRSESLQEVPIAITAVSEEDYRRQQFSDLKDMAYSIPNFNVYNNQTTTNSSAPYILGLGQDDSTPVQEQGVATYVDDVYMARSQGALVDLLDFERIEVLRGPQGTLYGKNAAGGALNVISQKPSQEPGGAVEVSAGDLGYLATRAKITGPLGDNLAGKLSVSYKERDGYVKSLVSDMDDLNSYDSLAVRGQLLSQPTDGLELLLTADYSDDDSTSPGRNVGTKFLQAQIVGAGPYDPGFYENLLVEEPHARIDSWGLSLQADWDVGSGTLTSITAYREVDADVRDLAFSAAYQYLGLASLDNFFVEQGTQFSQEIRYAVNLSESLFLQTGLYYLNEKVDRIESTAIVCGLICRRPVASPLVLPTSSADQSNETSSYGAFAQAVWSITDRLDLTLGGRYTYEKKEATNVGTPDGLFSIIQAYDVKMEESWDAFTPMTALNYDLSDNLSAYATISTGFKSGGFQGLAPTAIAASTPFDEEQVTNYELGLKGTVLDDTLRFALAAFHSAYDDLQVLVLTVQDNGLPGPQLTANAGKAQTQGLEAEVQWAIGSYWQLLATYAYLDTEYTDLENNLAPFEGNQLRNAPKNAYSMTAIFDHPLGSGRVNARADYTYKDKSYQDIQNQEEAAIPSYDTLNLRLAYAPASERWEVAAWLKNALDEEYLLHNSVLNPGLAQLPLPAPPRTWGVTATLKFGQ